MPSALAPHIAVRLRPLNNLETARNELIVCYTLGESTLRFQRVNNGQQQQQQQHDMYAYDRVYDSNAGNEEIYATSVKPLIQTALDPGYNALCFCYGPTGSGKTYTMSAIMRLAAVEIFSLIRQHTSRVFLLRVAALELYNETVTDLLAKNTSQGGLSPQGLAVRDDPEKGVAVDGLIEEGVEGVEHLEQLLARVQASRQVRETKLNAASSRSHMVVRIIIESRPAASAGGDGEDDNVRMSMLDFVDLAGNERFSQAAGAGTEENEKLRQKEACNINRSLLTLGTVIRALGDPANKHIPYRDSKLTRLLRPSLGGNAAMTIITTVSPAASCAETSKAALFFATAAKKIALSPQVYETADDSRTVIRRMQAEIDALKERMANSAWVIQLEKKDEEVRRAAEEKTNLERKLRNLEKLLLCGDNWVKGGRATDGINLAALDLAPAQDGATGGADWSGRSRNPAALTMRASWNPGTNKELTHSPVKMHPGMRQHTRFLLDHFVDTNKNGERISGAVDRDSSRKHRAAGTVPPKVDVHTVEAAIARMQPPKGPDTDAAVAALQAEVRCIAAAPHKARGVLQGAMDLVETEIEKVQAEIADMTPDAKGYGSKVALLGALREEQQRLLHKHRTKIRAAEALSELARKATLDSDDPDADPSFNAMPMWMQEAFAVDPTSFGARAPSSRGNDTGNEGICSVSPLSVGWSTSVQGAHRYGRHDYDDEEDGRDSGDKTPRPASKQQSARQKAVDVRKSADQCLSQMGSAHQQCSQGPDDLSRTENNSVQEPVNTPKAFTFSHASDRPLVVQVDVLKNKKAAVEQWYKSELRRIQAEFSKRAEADVVAVKEALELGKEQIDRLEVQKAMLLQQVLKLELALEEGQEARTQLQRQLREVTSERDRARFEELRAKAAARAAAAAAAAAEAQARSEQAESTPAKMSIDRLSIFDDGEDGWQAQDTPETLMTSIVSLWNELHIPLSYRARFYMGFSGREEVFYFELEHRRLEWKRSQWLASNNHKEEERAARALEWERKSLASSMKYMMNEEEREAVYREWSIDTTSKERKQQLVSRLWHPNIVAQPGGAERSAELVIALTGSEDPTEQLMQLVFGGSQGLQPRRQNVVANAVRRVTHVSSARRKSPGPSATPTSSSLGGGSTSSQIAPPHRTSSFGKLHLSILNRQTGTPSQNSGLPRTDQTILGAIGSVFKTGLTPRSRTPS